ncbi:PORCN palmitoleoyltransferase, partial [Rhinopomastus cyanomelas]|nr:PORCN palmitoleoyltransferase [Rhinopomastus cyanomelas]
MAVLAPQEFAAQVLPGCLVPTARQGLAQLWPLLLLCLGARLLHRLRSLKLVWRDLGGFKGVWGSLSGVWRGAMGNFWDALLMFWSYSSPKPTLRAPNLPQELHMVDTVTWHKMRGGLERTLEVCGDLGVRKDLKRLGGGAPVNLMGSSRVGGCPLNLGDSPLNFSPLPQSKAWARKGLRSLGLALLCLLISTCLAPFLFSCLVPLYGATALRRWLRAYESALSFHFSNYFVAFLSEATATLAGSGSSQHHDNLSWDLAVSRPLKVELPRSMADVVTNWNLPMSHWLHTYVFQTARRLGTFAAVLGTYAASALLHGLSFHLAAVLLSLGLITYSEHSLRQRLAALLDACILSRRCPPACSHRHKDDLWVRALNGVLGALALLHLAYLGALFDADADDGLEEQGYGMAYTIRKWSELHWAGHWATLGCWLLARLL